MASAAVPQKSEFSHETERQDGSEDPPAPRRVGRQRQGASEDPAGSPGGLAEAGTGWVEPSRSGRIRAQRRAGAETHAIPPRNRAVKERPVDRGAGSIRSGSIQSQQQRGRSAASRSARRRASLRGGRAKRNRTPLSDAVAKCLFATGVAERRGMPRYIVAME
jgi:hypothetical protein